MKVVKKNKRGSILLRVAILAFSAYVVLALINQQVQLSEKRKELDALNEQKRISEMKVEEIRQYTDENGELYEKYIKDTAYKDLKYGEQGVRVYVNIAGR